METRKVLSLVVCALLWAGTAVAQDPVKASPEVYKVLAENASVRVLRVSVPAGGKTAMHKHPDHVVIALGASKVRFTDADGKSQDAELAAESATFTPATAHSGANTGSTPVDAIVVEFKSAAPGKATLPAAREGLAMKVLAESPRGMVYKSTADPKFQEPAGTKHDYDQVVIALGPTQMSLSIDGKPAKTTWARGDVQLIARGTAHESKNAAGKPVDFIIVAIK